jgi:helicase
LFLSSRRNAEAAAKNAKHVIASKLTSEEKEELEKLSKEILDVLETPTKQCELLAECVKHGSAFHHAGLVSTQHRRLRSIVPRFQMI